MSSKYNVKWLLLWFYAQKCKNLLGEQWLSVGVDKKVQFIKNMTIEVLHLIPSDIHSSYNKST